MTNNLPGIDNCPNEDYTQVPTYEITLEQQKLEQEDEVDNKGTGTVD